MENENPNVVDDDALAGEEQGEARAEDPFELEVDGEVHTLPAALKGAFLRQADYTRKTQELAEHRRALEAERQGLAAHREALSGASSDRSHLAALDSQLAAYGDLDWRALAQADPQRAQVLWAQFQQTEALRDRYAEAISHHEAHGQVQAAREAAERMAETGRTLGREIEGWSPEVAAKLVDYAQAFGVSLEELSQAADPRLWKLLHKGYQADQAARQETTADAASRAQSVRPAVTVSGAGAGAAGVRDELGTREWMARRNAQTGRGR